RATGLHLAVAIAGLGGYFLARRALAPLGHMADRARTITAERLGQRLPVENPGDELGQLAAVFNDAFARLERSFEQLRRFTADASHELRTPLTAMRAVGEVGLREDRDAVTYRETIGSMLEETDRLGRLGGRPPLPFSPPRGKRVAHARRRRSRRAGSRRRGASRCAR